MYTSAGRKLSGDRLSEHADELRRLLCSLPCCALIASWSSFALLLYNYNFLPAHPPLMFVALLGALWGDLAR